MGNAVQQEAAIQTAQSFSAIVSMVACCLMFRKIAKDRKSNIANRMLVYLLFIDFVLCICYVAGRGGGTDPGFCQFQVSLILFFFNRYCYLFLLL